MTKKRILSLILAVAMVFALLPANFTAMKAEAAASNRVVGYFPSYRTYAMNSIDFSAMMSQ